MVTGTSHGPLHQDGRTSHQKDLTMFDQIPVPNDTAPPHRSRNLRRGASIGIGLAAPITLAAALWMGAAGAASTSTTAPAPAAGSSSSTSATSSGDRHIRPVLTDAQKECLADAGVKLPTPPAADADGAAKPKLPTEAERNKLHAALKKCGIEVPARPGGPGGPGGPGPFAELTDDQRRCLEDHGLRPPGDAPGNSEDANGSATPQRPTRERVEAAFKACDIDLPPLPERPVITDEQRACMTEAGVELPEPPAEGEAPTERPKLDEAQREAFRDAAEKCGLPLPGPGGPGGPNCEHPLQPPAGATATTENTAAAA